MKFIRTLASLKITVGLLAVIVVVLATATIIESTRGAEQARTIYYSGWFTGLLLALALNLVASLIEKWPYGKLRIGYLVTHGSMIIILVGSLMTNFMKIDGQIGLWEGETSNVIRLNSSQQETMELPYSLHLDAFEIDYYPGTRRPAMFRSRVTVLDPEKDVPLEGVIEMNRELYYRGFTFFQSSYQQSRGREATILSVSSDPGQNVVFVGYGLLVLGMMIVLLTRLLNRHTRSVAVDLPEAGGRSPGLPTLMVTGLILLAGWPVQAANLNDSTLKALKRLPVQHDGRVMPLDTQAREDVIKITGQNAWQGEDPVATVLQWSSDGRSWTDRPVVEVGDDALAEALGLQRSTRYTSYSKITANEKFFTLTSEARRLSQQDKPLNPVQNAALELENRLYVFRSYLQGEAIKAMPVSNDPADAWMPPASLAPSELISLPDTLRARGINAYPSERAMQREVLYNSLQPSRLSWLILLPTLLLSLWAWRKDQEKLDLIVSIGLLLGFAMMTWGLSLRWMVGGRIPASNMYESMLFLAWGTGLFALLAAIFSKNRLVIFNSAAMSTLTIFLTDVLPMDSFIHPMPPVLSGTPWLAIHVPIIMVSYSVFALAVLVAHMRVGIPIFAAQKKELAVRMDELLYWYMHVGSILLLAGILTGSIWAASSWGRYWGWDPKEVWSLIAFLAYMGILHGRLDRIIGPFGVAVASIAAFWTILMTYLGVNYVLAAGLHSYGFGGGHIVTWMLLFAAIEVGFLIAATAAERRMKRQAPA